MGEIIGYKGTELFSLSNLTNLTMEMIFANYVNNTVQKKKNIVLAFD